MRQIFEVLDWLLDGEKAFLFSTTIYLKDFESHFRKKHGVNKEFPLVKLKRDKYVMQ